MNLKSQTIIQKIKNLNKNNMIEKIFRTQAHEKVIVHHTPFVLS